MCATISQTPFLDPPIPLDFSRRSLTSSERSAELI